jgi:hypothetical protein
VEITAKAREHAKEMLKTAASSAADAQVATAATRNKSTKRKT